MIIQPEDDPGPDELRDLQLRRLQWTLAHVDANVDHHHDAFAAADFDPRDVRDLSDLRHVPFMTKADLRDGYPRDLFAVPAERVARIHASSGTTGRATVVGYTTDDLAVWGEVVARSLATAGARPGDVLHNAYGYGLFTGGLGIHLGAERLGCTVVPVSGGHTDRQVQLVLDLHPRVITITPSYFLAVLDHMESRGIDPRSTSLEVGIFGAEPWTDAMRDEIEERADIDAVDIYGLSEVIGPGVSQEAVATKDGLHVWEDHFYPEVVDPTSGEVLDDGQRGELVVTSLTKQALPVVRYRTGDLTTLRPGTARPSFRRMDRVTGRHDDMMIVRGVNVFPSQLEEIALGVPGLSPHYRCVLTRPDRLDHLALEVERTDDTSPDDTGALADRLAAAVKDRVGITVDVVVADPGTLARSQGKATRVVDHRTDPSDRHHEDRP